MSRKAPRKHISNETKLAAALGCLLLQQDRDTLRSQKVPYQEVLRRFDWHHIVPHTWGGSDDWYNLHPMLKDEHKQQTKRDRKAMAKSDRLIAKKWNLAPLKCEGRPVPDLSRRPLKSRGFDKTRKRKMDGTVVPRK